MSKHEHALSPILTKCFEALPSGGAVIICELLVNDDKTGPLRFRSAGADGAVMGRKPS